MAMCDNECGAAEQNESSREKRQYAEFMYLHRRERGNCTKNETFCHASFLHCCNQLSRCVERETERDDNGNERRICCTKDDVITHRVEAAAHTVPTRRTPEVHVTDESERASIYQTTLLNEKFEFILVCGFSDGQRMENEK